MSRALLVLSALAAILLAALVAPLSPRATPPTVDVSSIERLEAAYAPGPDGGAWPLYAAAIERLTAPPSAPSGRPLPGDADWAPWATWHDAHAELLPDLHAAATKTRLGRPYFDVRRDAAARSGMTFPLAHASIPSLLELRRLANFLCIAARVAEDDGRLDDALTHVEAAHGLARHLLARATVIEQMIGFALVSIAEDELDRLLRAHPDGWSRDRLRRLAASPVCRFELRDLDDAAAHEWDFVREALDVIFSDDGHVDPHHAHGLLCHDDEQVAVSFFHQARMLLHVDRAETLRCLTERWEASKRRGRSDPLASRETTPTEGTWTRLRRSLIDALDNSHVVAALARHLALTRVRRDRSAALVASMLYRADHGRWPGAYDDLAPLYLPGPVSDARPGLALAWVAAEGDGAPRFVSEARELERDRP